MDPLVDALQEAHYCIADVERLVMELARAQEAFQEAVAKVAAIAAIEQAKQEDH